MAVMNGFGVVLRIVSLLKNHVCDKQSIKISKGNGCFSTQNETRILLLHDDDEKVSLRNLFLLSVIVSSFSLNGNLVRKFEPTNTSKQ